MPNSRSYLAESQAVSNSELDLASGCVRPLYVSGCMCERRSRAGGTMKSASSPPMNSERQSMRSRISAPPEMPSGALLWRAAGEVRSSPLASKHRLEDDFDHGQSQEPSLVPGGYLLCIARRMRLAGCVL